MMLTRWKLLAGVFGLTVCGLAAIADPAAKPIPEIPGDTAKGDGKAKTAPDKNPLKEFKEQPQAIPAVAGTPSEVLPIPRPESLPQIDPVPASEPAVAEVQVPVVPEKVIGGSLINIENLVKEYAPKFGQVPAPATTPATAQVTTPAALPPVPPVPPESLPVPMPSEPLTPRTYVVPAGLPGSTTSSPAVPTPPAPAPVQLVTMPAPVPATVTQLPQVSFEKKLKVMLTMGDGSPRFEVRDGDEVVLKVISEGVDVRSPSEKGEAMSVLKALRRVKFVTPGGDGSCDELLLVPGTGEVVAQGNVTFKYNWGKVETAVTSEKMSFRLGHNGPMTLAPAR